MTQMQQVALVTQKSTFIAYLLLLFPLIPGWHRFYVGKVGSGILFLLTIGGVGLWYLWDLFFFWKVVNSVNNKNLRQARG